MTEFVILSGILVPIFTTVPILGKYLDIKATTIEAARYAAWERTVWSDPARTWNSGENSKSDEVVQREINARYFGTAPIGADYLEDDADKPFWVNHRGEALLTGAGQAGLQEYQAPVSTPVVDEIAFKGIPGLRELSNAGQAIDSSLGRLVSGCSIGIDFDKGLNLGARTFAEARVTVPVKGVAANSIYSFEATAAVLSDVWSAPDPQMYRRRVDSLVADELVGCAVIPGRYTFAVLSLGTDKPLYGEGRRSYPVTEAVDYRVLPPDRRP